MILATGSAAIQNATNALCSTSKSLLATLIILSVVLSILPILAGAGLFFFKKDNKMLRLAGMVLLALGILLIIGAVLGALMYVLAPVLVSSLTSGTQVNC